MVPPEDPGAIREGLSSHIEDGSRARDYGSRSVQRLDHEHGWRDGDFEVLNEISAPMTSTPLSTIQAGYSKDG